VDLQFFPNRYIDRTWYYKINELQNNIAEVQIIGKIINIKTVEFGKPKTIGGDFVDDVDKWNCLVSRAKWIRESLKLNM
jgi:ATP-dependent DNA helicase RecG